MYRVNKTEVCVCVCDKLGRKMERRFKYENKHGQVRTNPEKWELRKAGV